MAKKNKKTIRNDKLKDAEIINFLQKEYEYNRERMDGLQDRATELFKYNIIMLGFFVAFFDFKNFINLVINYNNCFHVSLATGFAVLFLIGAIFSCISLYKYYITFSVKDISCFEIEKLINENYSFPCIKDEYYKILKDYDDICDKIANKISNGYRLMMVGFVICVISLIILKILVLIKIPSSECMCSLTATFSNITK